MNLIRIVKTQQLQINGIEVGDVPPDNVWITFKEIVVFHKLESPNALIGGGRKSNSTANSMRSSLIMATEKATDL